MSEYHTAAIKFQAFDPRPVEMRKTTKDEMVIVNPTNYTNIENPQQIFVRADNTQCYLVDSFTIEILECALPDATIVLNKPLNVGTNLPIRPLTRLMELPIEV